MVFLPFNFSLPLKVPFKLFRVFVIFYLQSLLVFKNKEDIYLESIGDREYDLSLALNTLWEFFSSMQCYSCGDWPQLELFYDSKFKGLGRWQDLKTDSPEVIGQWAVLFNRGKKEWGVECVEVKDLFECMVQQTVSRREVEWGWVIPVKCADPSDKAGIVGGVRMSCMNPSSWHSWPWATWVLFGVNCKRWTDR